ncbi:MAG: hypothetical protein AAF320_02025 [Myxococcota bacterium]
MVLHRAPIPPSFRYLPPTALDVLLPALHRYYNALCGSCSK